MDILLVASKPGEGKDWIIGLTQVNICKRREREQAKEAVRLGPKGKWTGYGSLTWTYVNDAPPAYRMSLSYPKVIRAKRGKPVLPLY